MLKTPYIDLALDYIKQSANVATDSELSSYLGLKRTTVANWRHRGNINLGLISLKIKDIKIDYIECLLNNDIAQINRISLNDDFIDIIKRYLFRNIDKENVNIILSFIKATIGVATDNDLALYLGIGRNIIANWRFQCTIDFDLIKSKIPNFEIDQLLLILDYKESTKALLAKNQDLAEVVKLIEKVFENKSHIMSQSVTNAYKSNKIDDNSIVNMKANLNKLNLSKSKVEFKGVPYYDLDVTASLVQSFSDVNEEPAYFVDFKPFNDCDAYLPVYGDSMYPAYKSGEIIAVKQIKNFDFILWGEAYVVITNTNANDLRTLKLIHPHTQEDKVTLKSSNPNFAGNMVIKKEDIISLFIVKGKITRNSM